MSFDNIGKMTQECFDEITAIMAAEDRGEDPFNLKQYQRTDAQRAADAAAQARREAIAAAPVVVKSTGSKKAQAIALYNGLDDKSRKSVIAALVGIGFGAATASTYSSNLTSGRWS